MGLDSGTDIKKKLVAGDRTVVRGGLLPERLNEGLTWKACGEDNFRNAFYHQPGVKAVVVDMELWGFTMPENRFTHEYIRSALSWIIKPFLNESGALTVILVLLFDNAQYKPMNKAETSNSRAEATKEFVLPDEEIPTMFMSGMQFPGRREVFATPLFKQVFYNTVVGSIEDMVRELPVATPTCGVVVAAPSAKHDTFKISNCKVYDHERGGLQEVATTFFLTGRYYVFTRKSELDVSELMTYKYGEADLMMRVTTDWLQRAHPELFRDPDACIVACSKDSDSLCIYTLTPPGRVWLAMGTVAKTWLAAYSKDDVTEEHKSGGDGKADKLAFFVDVAELHKQLKLDNPVRRATFALACVLSGTDYVTRPKGIGAEKLYGALGEWRSPQQSRTDTRPLHTFRDGIFRAHTDGTVRLQKDEVVRAIAGVWKGNKAACLQFTKHHDWLFLRATWNILYWTMEDAERGGPSPLDYGWRPATPDEPRGYWAIIDGEPLKTGLQRPARQPTSASAAATPSAQAPVAKPRATASHPPAKKQMGKVQFSNRPPPVILSTAARSPAPRQETRRIAGVASRRASDPVESEDDLEFTLPETPLGRRAITLHRQEVSSDVEEIPSTPPPAVRRPPVISRPLEESDDDVPSLPQTRPATTAKKLPAEGHGRPSMSSDHYSNRADDTDLPRTTAGGGRFGAGGVFMPGVRSSTQERPPSKPSSHRPPAAEEPGHARASAKSEASPVLAQGGYRASDMATPSHKRPKADPSRAPARDWDLFQEYQAQSTSAWDRRGRDGKERASTSGEWATSVVYKNTSIHGAARGRGEWD
jgi:hypothetical protein